MVSTSMPSPSRRPAPGGPGGRRPCAGVHAPGPEDHDAPQESQTLMSAFLMISPNDARSRSMVARKAAGSWKLA